MHSQRGDDLSIASLGLTKVLIILSHGDRSMRECIFF